MENYSDEREIRRALRGGSWLDVDSLLRCSARDFISPVIVWYYEIGFRVVSPAQS
ncbi:MAG: hypothetical protein GTO45_33795, partial [Candidatus Aminicenantes bacterium]|nr:hypothetical protein [Candidatus Aminicenantes bacterium]NIM83683.1 hypothetical protein [Candidatus Aminicenantes bacterium]NIN23108.1 hypothetical protein [Candidatus Aminicenantes bacterium]NIN46835.1 hypothetical protein [Candidatus Aminicenantes bacterium]NIN89757.1 hypothetical protein [Candidatus Aminicenantes bacterium]